MGNNVCPWWLGYFQIIALRRFIQDPDKILNKYITQNMKVMDIGCGMGFFSLPLARLVGNHGKVVCVDLQEKMLEALRRRAGRQGLGGVVEGRKCEHNTLLVNDLMEMVDFVLAFAMVHEVPDKKRLFEEIRCVLKAGGSLLIAEPKGHVEKKAFDNSVALAEKTGFSAAEWPEIARSNAVLLKKR
jgi:ubiquinone/menaquinone biosynthesis C-methylase UbiE